MIYSFLAIGGIDARETALLVPWKMIDRTIELQLALDPAPLHQKLAIHTAEPCLLLSLPWYVWWSMKESIRFPTTPLQWSYDHASGALTPQWVNNDGCTFLVLVDIHGRSYVFAQLLPTRNSSPVTAIST